MKLWGSSEGLDKQAEAFTVGNDHIIDLNLVKHDCIASAAHAGMLNKIGIISKGELAQLNEGLNEIIALNEKGEFKISLEEEDCHTAIENFLSKKLGPVKIHTLRSRNDQVLTALRLYEKENLAEIISLVGKFIASLEKAISGNGSIAIPGYTHMQKAMPTTIGIWLSSFKDSAKDNIKLIDAVSMLINQSPLGSGAGFGVPDADREFTAKALGFSKAMENPMYCQLSRGKFEGLIIDALTMVMGDLNKLASDMLLFSTKEFGLVALPESLCTGSSIMPHKKNPDVLELVRAKYHIIVGEGMKVKGITGNLISGYNRDMQLTKEPLINSIEIAKSCIKIMALVIEKLKVNKAECDAAMSSELHSAHKVHKLVQGGKHFRDAYLEVKNGW